MKKYSCLVMHTRTGRIDFLPVYFPIRVGTFFGYGPDEKAPDGISRWIVVNCKAITD